MLPFRIAWRFLRTSPAQSLLIIGGIAVGVAVQIFVGSLIVSLQTQLIDQTTGSSPHITIADPKDATPVTYSALVRHVISTTPGVTAVAPTRQISALYSNGTDRVPLDITGGTLDGLDSIYQLRSRATAGVPTLALGQIVIGTDLAKKYGLSVGSPLRIVTGSGTPITLTVSGIVDLGSSAANLRQAFSGPDLPRRTLGFRADQYSAIVVRLADPFTSKTVAAGWQRMLPATKVSDWQADNKDLLTALQSQSASSYMIQVFVLVAVALGIASTLAISAVQKTRQIGILKALGMADSRTSAIFVWQSAILGVTGALVGIGLAFLLVGGFAAGTAGKAGSFPIYLQPGFVLFSAGVAVIVALLSSIIPSRRTGRLDPIEVIQNA
jgi:lipoprotein-releasing system permease protein